MNIFNIILGRSSKAGIIASPCDGTIEELSQLNDGLFSEKLLGEGCAILPVEGKIVAPCDGTIKATVKTSHSVGIVSDDGVEVLIHIGLDTAFLTDNDLFTCYVNKGDRVRKGDLLISYSREDAKKMNYVDHVIVTILNTKDYGSIKMLVENGARIGEDLLKVS